MCKCMCLHRHILKEQTEKETSFTLFIWSNNGINEQCKNLKKTNKTLSSFGDWKNSPAKLSGVDLGLKKKFDFEFILRTF